MKTYINTFETLSKKEIENYILGQEMVTSYFDTFDQELYEYFQDAQADYWIGVRSEGML